VQDVLSKKWFVKNGQQTALLHEADAWRLDSTIGLALSLRDFDLDFDFAFDAQTERRSGCYK
jgi:hypothetical protein